ncbi:hypothetical protein [Spiroplasma endosymbiont of Monopis laevigella]
MKKLLTTVSLLTFATTIGNLNSILSTEIKTTNIGMATLFRTIFW